MKRSRRGEVKQKKEAQLACEQTFLLCLTVCICLCINAIAFFVDRVPFLVQLNLFIFFNELRAICTHKRCPCFSVLVIPLTESRRAAVFSRETPAKNKERKSQQIKSNQIQLRMRNLLHAQTNAHSRRHNVRNDVVVAASEV